MDEIIEKPSSWRMYNSPDAQLRSRIDTVQAAGYTVGGAEYRVVRQSLDSVLVGAVQQGCGRLRFDGREWILRPGDLFHIDCRRPHEYHTEEEDWCFCWVHYDGEPARALLDVAGSRMPVVIGLGPDHQAFGDIETVGHLIRWEPPGIERDLKLARLLLRIQSVWLPGAHEKRNLSVDMKRTVDWIHGNFNKTIRLDDMAGVAGLSRYHFLRRFKDEIGESPVNYLIRVRIEQSKELLEGGTQTVEEIARLMGFGSSGSYIRHFRNRENITPLQFRKTVYVGR